MKKWLGWFVVFCSAQCIAQTSGHLLQEADQKYNDRQFAEAAVLYKQLFLPTRPILTLPITPRAVMRRRDKKPRRCISCGNLFYMAGPM